MYKASFLYAFVHFPYFLIPSYYLRDEDPSKGMYSYIELLSNRVTGSFLSTLLSHLVCTVQERRQCKQNKAVHTTKGGYIALQEEEGILRCSISCFDSSVSPTGCCRFESTGKYQTQKSQPRRHGQVSCPARTSCSQRNNLWFRSSIQQ